MNPAFNEVLSATAATRSGLFTATAQRLGTTPQNVEKDFWVCWTLDARESELKHAAALNELWDAAPAHRHARSGLHCDTPS